MNPVQQRIADHIASLPAEIAPLKDACLRYVGYCSAIDTDDTMMIAHRPWEAPLNYFIRLYPGAKRSWFSRYRKLHGITIPNLLHPLLTGTNGCFVFGISLFGMTPSMLQKVPGLNRSILQAHDLSIANHDWKSEYAGRSSHFHFGYRFYSDSENAGYFLTGNDRIVAALKDGAIVGEWSELGSFLADELAASEKRERLDSPEEWWH